MDKATIRTRINLLERLADPKRKSTPEHEREAAARMLKRYQTLLAKATEAADDAGYRLPERWHGERYAETRHLSLTEIAKLIRAEVKLSQRLAKLPAAPGAIKLVDAIGDAPTEVKISVRTEYYSGGGSINVTLKSIPPAWGWTQGRDRYGYECELPTPELMALAKAIRAIMDSYNYDGSDAMVDYYDVRFYGHVSTSMGRILA